MKQIYLFGYPLGHSISPSMQNAALRALGLDHIEYVKKPIPPEQMDEMIAALRSNDCIGANVTVPHKAAILPRLDEISELAQEIGAVNTVVKQSRPDGTQKLVGDNTDAYGFMESLRARRIETRGMCVVILGAGGAAAAAAYALAQAGAREIVLLNRSLTRAVALADRLNRKFPQMALALNDWDAVERARLVVNATSVGMSPHMDESPLPTHAKLAPDAVLYDLVYNPPETKFLHEAKMRGVRTIGGLEMLIYQGARALELWTGQPAPVEVMRRAAEEALEEITAHAQ
jgi:shikimate dehydrogenase